MSSLLKYYSFKDYWGAWDLEKIHLLPKSSTYGWRGLSKHWNLWLSDSTAHVLCPRADTIPPGPHSIMAISGERCQRRARCQELLKPQGERGKQQIISKGKYILLGSEQWIGDCWPESKGKGSPSGRSSGGRCPDAWECMPHLGMASSHGEDGVQENVDDGWGSGDRGEGQQPERGLEREFGDLESQNFNLLLMSFQSLYQVAGWCPSSQGGTASWVTDG